MQSNFSKLYVRHTGHIDIKNSSFELFEVRFDDKTFDYYFFAGENPPSEEVITAATEIILEEFPSEKSVTEFFTEEPRTYFVTEEGKNAEDYPSHTM